MRITHVRPRARLRPLAALALTGFLLSLAAHAASYHGVAVQERVPAVWGLHVGIFVVFVPFVFALRRWQRKGQLRWRQLLPYFPVWVRVAAPALMAYTMANFFAASSHLPSGGELSTNSASAAEEQVYTLRAFSGHWLIFYALPALFFMYVPAEAGPTEPDGTPTGGDGGTRGIVPP
ncbi:MAG TPA: hypothetical protein VF041_22310 [Gemmatimonadaceae bacterium]